MKRFFLMIAAATAMSFVGLAAKAEPTRAVMYKSPWCGCCTSYGEYLRDNGFEVEVKMAENLTPVKRIFGIKPELESCHTVVIGRYVVEGHVPLEHITKLLEENSDVRGIALPGMPTGVPGMDGDKEGPLNIYTIEDTPKVFAVE